MRILFLNWRDLTHPRAGGAEVVVQGIAERCASDGHFVTFFASSVRGRPRDEGSANFRIVRRGTRTSVYVAGMSYAARYGSRFDVIVDHINTVPFFSPLVVKRTPVVAMIHQLARDVWDYEAPWPLSRVGQFAEPMMLSVYRTRPALTISESTAQDLRSIGWHGTLRIITMPLTDMLQSETGKAEPLSFVYLGRLTPSKRVDHAIHAFKEVKALHPDAKLNIVGSGHSAYVDQLRQLAAGDPAITFTGRVSVEDRRRELRRAHVLLATSIREGWGLVVTEAFAQGTLVAAYDVPGLRDSVRPPSGLLARAGDWRDLATKALTLATSTDYEARAGAARSCAASHSWDRTMTDFYSGLHEVVR